MKTVILKVLIARLKGGTTTVEREAMYLCTSPVALHHSTCKVCTRLRADVTGGVRNTRRRALPRTV